MSTWGALHILNTAWSCKINIFLFFNMEIGMKQKESNMKKILSVYLHVTKMCLCELRKNRNKVKENFMTKKLKID